MKNLNGTNTHSFSGYLFALTVFAVVVLSGIFSTKYIFTFPESGNIFINFYSPKPVKDVPAYSPYVLLLGAIVQLAGVLLLIGGLLKKEFIKKESHWMMWGLYGLLCGIVLWGFCVRVVSNHAAAAQFFFYGCLLYFLLTWVQHRNTIVPKGLTAIHILPAIITLIYIMGQPASQKLFNSASAVPK